MRKKIVAGVKYSSISSSSGSEITSGSLRSRPRPDSSHHRVSTGVVDIRAVGADVLSALSAFAEEGRWTDFPPIFAGSRSRGISSNYSSSVENASYISTSNILFGALFRLRFCALSVWRSLPFPEYKGQPDPQGSVWDSPTAKQPVPTLVSFIIVNYIVN